MQSEIRAHDRTQFNLNTNIEKPMTKAQISSRARKRRIERSKRAIKIKEAQERRKALKAKQKRLAKDQLLRNAAINQAKKIIEVSTDPHEVREANEKLTEFEYRLPGTRAQRRQAACTGSRTEIHAALKKKFGKVEL